MTARSDFDPMMIPTSGCSAIVPPATTSDRCLALESEGYRIEFQNLKYKRLD